MNQYTKMHSRETMNQHTHKKKFMKRIQPTQNNWCSFWKILEKVNVPNQHVIFRESVENQHVSHVFIDHLYPSKYAIVSYPFHKWIFSWVLEECCLCSQLKGCRGNRIQYIMGFPNSNGLALRWTGARK